MIKQISVLQHDVFSCWGPSKQGCQLCAVWHTLTGAVVCWSIYHIPAGPTFLLHSLGTCLASVMIYAPSSSFYSLIAMLSRVRCYNHQGGVPSIPVLPTHASGVFSFDFLLLWYVYCIDLECKWFAFYRIWGNLVVLAYRLGWTWMLCMKTDQEDILAPEGMPNNLSSVALYGVPIYRQYLQ